MILTMNIAMTKISAKKTPKMMAAMPPPETDIFQASLLFHECNIDKTILFYAQDLLELFRLVNYSTP